MRYLEEQRRRRERQHECNDSGSGGRCHSNKLSEAIAKFFLGTEFVPYFYR